MRPLPKLPKPMPAGQRRQIPRTMPAVPAEDAAEEAAHLPRQPQKPNDSEVRSFPDFFFLGDVKSAGFKFVVQFTEIIGQTAQIEHGSDSISGFLPIIGIDDYYRSDLTEFFDIRSGNVFFIAENEDLFGSNECEDAAEFFFGDDF